MLRIPYSHNSKCIDKGKDPEVKIIQKFDTQNIPQINTSLLREFSIISCRYRYQKHDEIY